MRVSICVCTRNRSASIVKTLQAISELEYPDFETLVIDNSNDLEKTSTAQATERFGASYLYEPRRGLNVARNTGVANAKGSIIAFTDDDCLPQREWLRNTVPNFANPVVKACTSRILQHTREGAADLLEAVAGQDLGNERMIFTGNDVRFGIGFLITNATKVFAKHLKSRAPVPFGIGHGSGMLFKRDVFDLVGTFDERFGSGAKLLGCDDLEMLYRVLKGNYSIVYEPSAVVRHDHRFSAEEVFKLRRGYSCSGAIFMRHYKKDPRMRLMFYGRLIQLLIKTTQYKVIGDKELANSFGSDLEGFIDGWQAYRRFQKELIQSQKLNPSTRVSK